MPLHLSLGYSPCPNDTFIFYALIHGKIPDREVSFREILLDVENLNQKALSGELDITKISFSTLGHIRDTYCLLRSGSALGRGCGPLIVSKYRYSIKELRSKTIAIPGKMTTAFLLLQLYDPEFRNSDIREIPFDRIMPEVAKGSVDVGLIIHEGRFTYPSYGLIEIMDLGRWWEEETGLPIPLGGIVAKRSLQKEIIKKVEDLIKQSIMYAFTYPDEPMDYIKTHAQEMSDEVIRKHIELYVNDFSVDLGDEGIRAVRELISRAEDAGIIPPSKEDIFIV